jgi:hypothetical protein
MRLGNNNSGIAGNPGAQGVVNGQNPNVGLAQPQGDTYQQQPNAADMQAANRTPEENVLLYEANRLKNDELRKAGMNLPRLPQHPWLGGQGQPQPQ